MSLRLNAGNDGDSRTYGGRLFQMREAATGNARSPTVDNRAEGTTKETVEADLKRCRPSMSEACEVLCMRQLYCDKSVIVRSSVK